MKFAILALICLFALALAQDNVPSMTTSEFAGVPTELVALVEAAEAAIVSRITIDPTLAEYNQYKADVLADNVIAQYSSPETLGLDTIVTLRNSLLGVTETSKSMWETYKAALIAQLLQRQTEDNAWADNRTAEREAAVDADLDLVDRTKSALLVTGAELSQREVAVGLVQIRYLGQSNEVRFKLNTMMVKILNNTIAQLNNSKVGDQDWAVQDKAALFADMVELATFARVASERATRIQNFKNKVAEESQAITEELNERLSAIRAGTFTDIEEIKSDWRADSTETQTIEDRLAGFIGSDDVKVDVSGLDGTGNVTLNADIAIARPAGATQEEFERTVEDAVEAYLVAYTGLKENEVTANIVTRTKRQTAPWLKVKVQMGKTNNLGNPTNPTNLNNSAQALAAGFAVVLVALFALF